MDRKIVIPAKSLDYRVTWRRRRRVRRLFSSGAAKKKISPPMSLWADSVEEVVGRIKLIVPL